MSSHTELPRSDTTPHPRRLMLEGLRPPARLLTRRRFGVQVHGADQVPATGPVIFAANHVGVLDGPLLGIWAPRPVHAMTKLEMFHGRTGRFLLAAGQVPLDRFHPDPAAVRACLRVLRDGHAIGIFPEGTRGAGDLRRFHRGAAYLALVTGAPVVPVILLGSRPVGGHHDQLPPKGGPVDLVFGAPYLVEARPWPRTREQVADLSVLLREHLLDTLEQARALTGRDLPGPLPAAEVEPDPATGITDQGAP